MSLPVFAKREAEHQGKQNRLCPLRKAAKAPYANRIYTPGGSRTKTADK